MKKIIRPTLPLMELFGIAAVVLSAAFMRRLYKQTGSAAGILFGAVNRSPWELCKTLMLPYLLWGMAELVCLKPPLRRFTTAKTAGLYCLGLLYLSARLTLPVIGENPVFELISAVLCLCFSAVLTRLLLHSPLHLGELFAPSLALLLLFLALYCSFTPFPPDLKIFYAGETRGIAPFINDIICR